MLNFLSSKLRKQGTNNRGMPKSYKIEQGNAVADQSIILQTNVIKRLSFKDCEISRVF